MKYLKDIIVILSLIFGLFNGNIGLYSRQNLNTTWESAVSPDADLEELAALEGTLFARSDDTLYKSTDFGATWQQVKINQDIRYLLDMDVDNGDIYIATKDGVIISSDGGQTFKWSYDSRPDTSTSVDFEQEYGWLIVNMWGAKSGPHKKSPNGTWQFARSGLPYDYLGVLRSIVADRRSPGDIAFTYGSRGDTGPRYFRTIDGGKNWLECQCKVIYTTIINGTSYALGESQYSIDTGETWQTLPFTAVTFIKNRDNIDLFAAKSGGGVYKGTPDNFYPIGLDQKTIQSFAFCGNYLFALSTSGEIFKTLLIGTLSVTSPIGGELWTGNSINTITWTSPVVLGNVKLEYSSDNGTTWEPIVSSTANDGTYLWVVPNISSTSCLVRVSEIGGSTSATSDGVFSITRYSCSSVCAANQSTETLCAEEDNINIPIYGNLQSFVIEATHPDYSVGTDNCEADFTNCPGGEPGFVFTPRTTHLYNDGTTIVETVTESEWWLPNGMDVSVDSGEVVSDVHYVRLYRKIQDESDYPQFFVLYMDGNLRLIPQPPAGTARVCFGSSVLVGPAAVAERPFAEISSIKYNSSFQTLDVYYKAGGSAAISILDINRSIARLRVSINYSITDIPFATFRSMFVENSNSDVDCVRWEDVHGIVHDDPIFTFAGGEGIGWFFYRNNRSQHNTSAPDIWIGVESPAGILPQIQLSRSRLDFGGIPTGTATPSQDFLITNKGMGTLNWSITNDQAWLSCSPSSGSGPGPVSVSVSPYGLTEGTYSGIITVSDPDASNSPQILDVTLTVYVNGKTSITFGHFATPIDGSIVTSSIPVTGWALDDIGVESVKIYRGEVGNLVYIGDALFVEGARPDVEAAYPGYPMNYRAGWGYMMLTNFFPNGGNGTFKIYAIAIDIEGHRVTLGTKNIICDNANAVKPFGAIDTPTQGGIASGSSFINWGWVLTPQPNSIPTDGSTINVYVDGINLGHPIYNIYRSDIANLFPGYANSDGASGYFYLDTYPYENGVHTIQWTSTDSNGNSDGIGSRYFTIQNIGNDQSKAKTSRSSKEVTDQKFFHLSQLSDIPINDIEFIKIRKELKDDSQPIVVNADEKGVFNVKIKELEQLKIELSSKPFLIAGYTIVGNQLGPLPIGSTLDTKTGKFHWQLGPGFVGCYRFVFIEKNQDNQIRKKHILVMIESKFAKIEITE
jgi:hypothetical protein